jgi:AraC-like DNA-binding protein
VGLIIRPNSEDSIINLLHYNQFHLDIEGEDVESIALYIFTRNNLKNSTSNNPELCFQSTLDISSERNQYKILLDQLRIPDWWSDFNNISRDEKIQLDLKEVLHINIGTTYTPKLGTERWLRIHSIRFERNNSPLLKALLLAELLIFLLLIIVHGLLSYSKQKPAQLTIAYKPLTIDNVKHQPNGFMEYINSHFHDQSLTLEQITAKTGINQRRIAQSIQDNYNCNFKTYVNQIRITEAKRLFKESSLNMGEISYRVGFNNQSHFNRVFKNLVGISPTEFREHKI